MSTSVRAAIIRHVARRCHDRRVWLGERCAAGGAARRLERLLARSGFRKVVGWQDHRDTAAILRRFPEVDTGAQDHRPGSMVPEALRAEWTAAFIDRVARIQRRPPRAAPMPAAFTVVVPFFAHRRYLKSCLASVDRAARKAPDTPLELIVVNDDPAVDDRFIERVIPRRLADRSRILKNPSNMGVCAALNRAAQAARHPWLLHLDCDDQLSGDALRALRRHIGRHPAVRYISSRMLDVDADGRLLRVRLRAERPAQLISHGMVAGHLKAIRRDLLADLGPYQEMYAGCQDFEFALRVSLFEPLLFIPDYLYRYRWHGRTQSVARARRQALTANRIIDAYLLAERMLSTGVPPAAIAFGGPAAGQWRAHYPPADQGVAGIHAEMRRPFNPKNQHLFAIHVAHQVVARHGQSAPVALSF